MVYNKVFCSDINILLSDTRKNSLTKTKNVSEKKIEAKDTGEIKVKTDAPRRVPKNLPKLHFLNLICGMRGSGKSSIMVKLILEYDKTERRL